MPPPHFVFDRTGDGFRIELAGFLTEHDLKREVEHQVSELVFDLGEMASPDGLVELQDFFDQIGAQGFARLCRVPGTAFSEVAHQLDHASKR